MPVFGVFSCILYTKMAKCRFFNKVFGSYATFFARKRLLSPALLCQTVRGVCTLCKSPLHGKAFPHRGHSLYSAPFLLFYSNFYPASKLFCTVLPILAV